MKKVTAKTLIRNALKKMREQPTKENTLEVVALHGMFPKEFEVVEKAFFKKLPAATKKAIRGK